jgi:hypothetical protein
LDADDLVVVITTLSSTSAECDVGSIMIGVEGVSLWEGRERALKIHYYKQKLARAGFEISFVEVL